VLRIVLQSALDMQGRADDAREVECIAGPLLHAKRFIVEATQFECADCLLQR
jgi:hypothetical protein